MTDCIFCQIIAKTLPAKIIYEDEEMIAFHDIHPKAQIHFIVIPKLHIESMLELKQHHTNMIGKIMVNANIIAKEQGLTGYKVHINTGVAGGQEVFHLHVHILGNKE
ncbi:MAG: HIT domain-containing protein [Burkholderiales bacterium]|nr:HIT domain-containing protein [Burkholderiales bacterium]